MVNRNKAILNNEDIENGALELCAVLSIFIAFVGESTRFKCVLKIGRKMAFKSMRLGPAHWRSG